MVRLLFQFSIQTHSGATQCLDMTCIGFWPISSPEHTWMTTLHCVLTVRLLFLPVALVIPFHSWLSAEPKRKACVAFAPECIARLLDRLLLSASLIMPGAHLHSNAVVVCREFVIPS